MLGEFTSIYDIHRWARYATWIGLFSMALFLTWLSGGLPPPSWRLLLHSIQQLSHARTVHAFNVLFSLAGLAVVSLVWGLAWVLLLWAVLGLLWHHWRWMQREHRMTWMDACIAPRPLLRRNPAHKYVRSVFKGIPMPLAEPMQEARRNGHSANGRAIPRPFLAKDTTESIASIPLLRLPQQPPSTAHLFWGTPMQGADVLTPPGDTDPRLAVALAALSPVTQAVHPFQVGVGWHVGKSRQGYPNEDSLAVLQSICACHNRFVQFGFFVIADGMGGHAYGQEASRITIQMMIHTVAQGVAECLEAGVSNASNGEAFIEMLVRGVKQANEAICQLNEEMGEDMGTTLTAALIHDKRGYVVNVGDSRTYLYRDGQGLSRVTQDHSLVAQLVADGKLEPDDVYTHPERNKVSRSVGTRGGVVVDWFIVDMQPGDRLLLCSDGLWEMVRDPVIESIMGSKADMTIVSARLLQAALTGGGADNISVVVAKVV
jgi:serine/threonine protein phosphatase PrpC